ncbi:TorF family putative porin [Lysobacter sp. CFH 32150]|uniref:TorF family putative porin n=1 Tax=Lysobacter sp. CFH 32150 TaxID=2927128 RepID=UPI001FA6D95A|nr:TorF family putative porin [Lysobacter sp. CFH 32150]
MFYRAVVLCAWLFVCDARAQVSGSVALVSDYRLRGVSLSDRGPAVQFGLAYDRSNGWYAGAFASSLKFGRAQQLRAQLLSYAGYAWRLRDGLDAEAGVSYSAFFGGTSGYDYPELYVGLSAERLSGRLYYAPRYFREETPVVYAELNFAQPLSEHVRLLAHLGRLQRGRSEETDYGLERHRLDARLGLGTTLHDFDLQLAWVHSEGERGHYPSYPVCRDCVHRGTWVLSVSRSW